MIHAVGEARLGVHDVSRGIQQFQSQLFAEKDFESGDGFPVKSVIRFREWWKCEEDTYAFPSRTVVKIFQVP